MGEREDYLLGEIERLLAPHVMDGTEAHAIVEQLAAEVRDASGNMLAVRASLFNSKARLRALLSGTVPIDVARDAVIRITENMP